MSATIPSAKQIEFLGWEFGVFFHFGIRTFYEGHRDWDGKPMPLEGFNPPEIDCDGWIRTVRDAGAKYAILVCKHHDGFANWPSKYTDYSIANTPYMDGKGDVVRDFTEACRKYGIKVGLYYSPAQFGSREMSPREYDDYFIGQIGELLTGYGKIDYLWFDGCGSEGHRFDSVRIIKAIRSMQPEIIIFNMWDPDTRWVENEEGVAGIANSSVLRGSDGSAVCLPAECDFRMREANWFYSDADAHTVKSLDELMGLYYLSVGCGANMLINIGPGRDGKLPEPDASRLLEFGAEIRRRFSNPVSTEFERRGDKYVIKLGGRRLVNHLVLGEDIASGERIEGFRVTANIPVTGGQAQLYEGRTVGHKRIVLFPTIRASELTVEVTACDGSHSLASAAAYYVEQPAYTPDFG